METIYCSYNLCIEWHSYSVYTRSSFQDGSPPLHSAVSGNQQEIVEFLIEKYNADPAAAATMVSLISTVYQF